VKTDADPTAEAVAVGARLGSSGTQVEDASHLQRLLLSVAGGAREHQRAETSPSPRRPPRLQPETFATPTREPLSARGAGCGRRSHVSAPEQVGIVAMERGSSPIRLPGGRVKVGLRPEFRNGAQSACERADAGETGGLLFF
jgi:hypothetical protein